jgi:hypothetical protein
MRIHGTVSRMFRDLCHSGSPFVASFVCAGGERKGNKSAARSGGLGLHIRFELSATSPRSAFQSIMLTNCQGFLYNSPCNSPLSLMINWAAGKRRRYSCPYPCRSGRIRPQSGCTACFGIVVRFPEGNPSVGGKADFSAVLRLVHLHIT